MWELIVVVLCNTRGWAQWSASNAAALINIMHAEIDSILPVCSLQEHSSSRHFSPRQPIHLPCPCLSKQISRLLPYQTRRRSAPCKDKEPQHILISSRLVSEPQLDPAFSWSQSLTKPTTHSSWSTMMGDVHVQVYLLVWAVLPDMLLEQDPPCHFRFGLWSIHRLCIVSIQHVSERVFTYHRVPKS